MLSNAPAGFIRTIVLILIAILLLSYFGIDLRQAATTPLFKQNLQFTWEVIQRIWNDYIYVPLTHLFKRDQQKTLDASTP